MKRLLLLSALVFLALPGARAQITTLSGKVVMADGGQLPDKVAIQRDCGGAPMTAAFVDRSGQFTFRWNQPDGFAADASSAASGRGPRGSTDNGIEQGSTMRGCALLATAPSYRSDPLALDGLRASFENYDVGTIVLHAIENAPGLSVSATAVKAPSAAKKAFDKGMEAFGKGKTEDAEKNFEKRSASIRSTRTRGWTWAS